MELAKHVFDFGVEPIQLRPYPGDNTQKRGYPLRQLADAWRRYLSPLLLPAKAVNAVTGDTRKMLDEYFDYVQVDDDGNPAEDRDDVTACDGFSAQEGQIETEPVVTSPSGAPNFAEVLGRPQSNDWSPFDAKPPRNRR
jgi:hypothetical protein